MKTLLSAASVALLLTACGGNSESPASRSAPQALRSATAVRAAADYKPLLQNLYIGFFGRPADAGGLEYWSQFLSERELPLTFDEWVSGYASNPAIKSVLDNMADSVEAQGLYVSNNSSFINAIYLNGFSRIAEASGSEYWAGLIDQGAITRAQAVLAILSGASGSDAAILARKTQAAVTFTSLLNTDALKLAYSTGGYSDGARELLAAITPTTDLSVFRADIQAFVATLETSPGIVVRRYVGYHYLQDVKNEPLYAASYRYAQASPLIAPTAGSLNYGASPRTIAWTRSDAAVFAYAAPVTSSVNLWSEAQLPVLTMLCGEVVSVSGVSTKSTDVLVARSAVQLTEAAQLAGQRFTVYRENCATGGSHIGQMQFDAQGNGTFPSGTGLLTVDAAAVTSILKGQVVPDLLTGKYLAYSAYRHTRPDGSLRYFIVQHLGNRKTKVSDGVLAVWAQE